MEGKYRNGGPAAAPEVATYYDRQATAQTTVAPKPTSEVTRDAVQMATYIITLVTCTAVLITLACGWYEYFRFVAALNDLHNQLGGIGG